MDKCKCTRKKHRTGEEKEVLIKRLNRIEGQVKGIKQMIIDDRYCDEVLIQISAVNKSLKSLGNEMLKNHLATCVVEDIKNDNLNVIDDIVDLFGKLNK
jgi:DNA-binding FrmR family transcriptional regulator